MRAPTNDWDDTSHNTSLGSGEQGGSHFGPDEGVIQVMRTAQFRRHIRRLRQQFTRSIHQTPTPTTTTHRSSRHASHRRTSSTMRTGRRDRAPSYRRWKLYALLQQTKNMDGQSRVYGNEVGGQFFGPTRSAHDYLATIFN